MVKHEQIQIEYHGMDNACTNEVQLTAAHQSTWDKINQGTASYMKLTEIQKD